MSQLKMDEAFGPENLPAIEAKIKSLGVPEAQLARWCEAKRECACMGCANKYLTWREYECWRKYSPQFNRLRRG